MTAHKISKPLMAARVVRAIAILFLVYTAADLTVPQFCAEEMGIPRFAEASASSNTQRNAAIATGASDSRQDPTPEPTHSDEDCFCCCAHVLPGRAPALVSVSELNSVFATVKIIDVVSPPLQGPYHPPRFS